MSARGWDQATSVVTPEAVALEFREANVGSRTAAILVDLTLVTVVLWLLNITIGFLVERTVGGVPSWVAVTGLLLINFCVVFGYPLAFETLTHGRTPGKMVMGLRVVTVEGAPVRFRHAAIRSAFWLVDFGLTLGIAAVLAVMVSRRHQRLGDMVAGTVVLRERSAAPAPAAASFDLPRGLESYAETIDTTNLAPRDYEVLRDLLLRSPGLHEGKRDEIAQRLATSVAQRIGHDIPSEVSALAFLQCVAARYQRQRAPHHVQGDVDQPAHAADGAPIERWGDFTPPS